MRRALRLLRWTSKGNAMKVSRRRFLQLAAGAAALPTVSRTACVQAYPARPIRLVVPFPPGGAFDFVGRPRADKMKALLGTVVVENMGGVAAVPWVPPRWRTRRLTATRFYSAGRCPTSTKPSSRVSPCMIRPKTWTRSRVSRPIFFALLCIQRSRFRKGTHSLRSSQSGQALLRARGCSPTRLTAAPELPTAADVNPRCIFPLNT